jgi:hypothetical protein
MAERDHHYADSDPSKLDDHGSGRLRSLKRTRIVSEVQAPRKSRQGEGDADSQTNLRIPIPKEGLL